MTRHKDSLQQQVLSIAGQFLLESNAERAYHALSLKAQLEKELGIGSLEKAELINRLETHFNVTLSTAAVNAANTLADLAKIISKANPKVDLEHLSTIETLPDSHIDDEEISTINDALRVHTQRHPQRPHVYLQDEFAHETIIRYTDLDHQARCVANSLLAFNVKPGYTVAIMLPTSTEFLAVFCGVLLVGAIPVPIYPPIRANQVTAYVKQESHILNDAEVYLLVTFASVHRISKLLQSFIPTLKVVVHAKSLLDNEPTNEVFAAKPQDYALIQYTSGSTGNPKGVLLQHQNLIANIRAYRDGCHFTSTDIAVSWLPLYHDLGLIANWLGCLYLGIPLTLMSPLTFLQRPERWLWAIHYHRATLAASPNFGFELCVKKINKDHIRGLDLSSWRMAANGAEPIYPQTIAAFTSKFAEFGFNPKIMCPVYGLAESCVALTVTSSDEAVKFDTVGRKEFEEQQIAVPVSQQTSYYYQFVCCGKPLPNHHLRIVDEHNITLPERHIGHLQFSGPSTMQGYYKNSDATKAVYHDGWWSTGDLGYLADDELYLTGRVKDLIIKAGRNYSAAEIEKIVGEHNDIRMGCVVAFGMADTQLGTEKIIVVAEKRNETQNTDDRIIETTTATLIERTGISIDEVVLVAARTIPKTSSGKLRRNACKMLYMSETLNQSGTSAASQFVKLKLASLWQRIRRSGKLFCQFAFTVYFALSALLVILSTWLLILCASKPASLRIIKFSARLIFRIGFSPIKIVGKDNILKHQPQIFIANHTSYADTVLLLATLPMNTIFVGKKELLKVPILATFIRKLKHITVDRESTRQEQHEQEAQNILNNLNAGKSIVIFPEGTFTHLPGVRPFRAGAFSIAAASQCPICPLAIKNVRKIMPGKSWLLAPHPVELTALKPISVNSASWEDIVAARDHARIIISQYSGEALLDLASASLRVNSD